MYIGSSGVPSSPVECWSLFYRKKEEYHSPAQKPKKDSDAGRFVTWGGEDGDGPDSILIKESRLTSPAVKPIKLCTI